MENKKFPPIVWNKSPFDQKAEDYVYSQPTKTVIQSRPRMRAAYRPYVPEELIMSRSCPEVSRQLAHIKEFKKTETYKKACQMPGYAEYTSLVEYKIAQSSKCGGKCDYCLHAAEAGF